MTSLAQRKQIALEQKLDALDREFETWTDLTQTPAFEKHHSQVIAITGHLKGLRRATRQIFRSQDEDILTRSRNLESLTLGIRRIWEFFRSKLVQRRDAAMHDFLELADELAWACYKPVLDLAGAPKKRQPPLVFLNGGLSPYALSRDRAFPAEEVPGEPLGGNTYEPVLKHLPVAVIGVPYSQASHLPDLPVVAHETGHTIEQGFGLHEEMIAHLKQKLGSGNVEHWCAWSSEVFADLWGCLTLGPAFANSLMDFLASSKEKIENDVATTSGKYPTSHLRMLICFDALETDFPKETAALRALWSSCYERGAMPGFEAETRLVGEAILGGSYAILNRSPWQMEKLRMTPKQWTWVQDAAEQAQRDRDPDKATSVRLLVAAARVAYDTDPAGYKTHQQNERFTEYGRKLIKPGTRAGEEGLREKEKADLATVSEDAGAAWFQEFAAWAAGGEESTGS